MTATDGSFPQTRDRVRFKKELHVFGTVYIPVGATGTIFSVNWKSDVADFVSIKLDFMHTGLGMASQVHLRTTKQIEEYLEPIPVGR